MINLYDDFSSGKIQDDENLQCLIYNSLDSLLTYEDHERKHNCTLPDIVDFPNLFRKKGIINPLLCTLMSVYLFIMLAIICDEYLVPAMERLCYSLHLSYDVAGATFLAGATSAPELFVACVGTFITEGDIGVGTIVGSSVFNILGIAAVCGIATGIESQLDWWPVTRDIVWYMVAVLILFVILHDSKVATSEAYILLFFYIVYVVTLALDRKIQRFFRTIDDSRDMINEDPLERTDDERLNSFKENLCTKPEPDATTVMKVWWAIQYPAIVILAVTTPSPRAPLFLTTLVSVIWICLLTYAIAWFLTVIGYNLSIPDGVMGLTILAVGTSIPELVASYIVCKKGLASMAISNAIGSNTFDILICLGLPWTIKSLVTNAHVSLNSKSLQIVIGMLIVSACLFYMCFLLTKFVLGKLVGWLALSMYVLFIIFSLYIEMNNVNETCDIESDEFAYLN